jgi:hypothetical protein
MLGGGWVKEYFEPNISSVTFDIQRTSSLVSPYSGRLNFELLTHYTAFHKSSAEAAVDSDFTQVSSVLHKHTYAYQDGRWVPQVRRYVSYGGEYDCTEVINIGPDAGEVDIHGCLEEYDGVPPKSQTSEKGNAEQTIFINLLQDAFKGQGLAITPSERGEVLVLESDIFKNVAVRSEFAKTILASFTKEDSPCKFGFRQVLLTSGEMGQSYPLGCQ